YEYGVQELDDGSRKKATRKVERPVPEPRKCPKCAHVHRARPTCPSCGFEYPRPSRIVHAPGELFERTVAMPPAERREVHAQLLWLARVRGKKDGWAYHLTKERTGAYPTGPLPEPKPPSPELERWVTSQLIRWVKSQKRNAA